MLYYIKQFYCSNRNYDSKVYCNTNDCNGKLDHDSYDVTEVFGYVLLTGDQDAILY
jgi:hypothetical protein